MVETPEEGTMNKPPRRVRARGIPETLVNIGQALAVEYRRDDGEIYRHDFTSEVWVGLADGAVVLVGPKVGPTLENMIEG